jgi:hypothetical protein
VRELGADEVINYRTAGDLAAAFAAAKPNSIDVYFEMSAACTSTRC